MRAVERLVAVIGRLLHEEENVAVILGIHHLLKFWSHLESGRFAEKRTPYIFYNEREREREREKERVCFIPRPVGALGIAPSAFDYSNETSVFFGTEHEIQDSATIAHREGKRNIFVADASKRPVTF